MVITKRSLSLIIMIICLILIYRSGYSYDNSSFKNDNISKSLISTSDMVDDGCEVGDIVYEIIKYSNDCFSETYGYQLIKGKVDNKSFGSITWHVLLSDITIIATYIKDNKDLSYSLPIYVSVDKKEAELIYNDLIYKLNNDE